MRPLMKPAISEEAVLMSAASVETVSFWLRWRVSELLLFVAGWHGQQLQKPAMLQHPRKQSVRMCNGAWALWARFFAGFSG